jgi:hypothetical protein
MFVTERLVPGYASCGIHQDNWEIRRDRRGDRETTGIARVSLRYG